MYYGRLENPCRYNKESAVVCSQPYYTKEACAKCGWNPEVREKRVKKVKEEHGDRVQAV